MEGMRYDGDIHLAALNVSAVSMRPWLIRGQDHFHYVAITTYPVIAESVVQRVARQDVRVIVDLVQGDHQAGDPSCAHVSSTERLHESEVERRSPFWRILEGGIHL